MPTSISILRFMLTHQQHNLSTLFSTVQWPTKSTIYIAKNESIHRDSVLNLPLAWMISKQIQTKIITRQTISYTKKVKNLIRSLVDLTQESFSIFTLPLWYLQWFSDIKLRIKFRFMNSIKDLHNHWTMRVYVYLFKKFSKDFQVKNISYYNNNDATLFPLTA